ncbi:MAG TPA: methyltransferase domain-containing protein [Gaiella sp.]|nr:methyltransferase domain-containing protein [Gaiella sp.]
MALTDASFDGALSVQVLEYVADVGAALAELHRVVRPGGRVVVWDVDWSTAFWHSANPTRMEGVLAA